MRAASIPQPPFTTMSGCSISSAFSVNAITSPRATLSLPFGQFMFPAFYKRYPQLIDGHSNMLDFLESLDSVIHVEVVKLYPGAITPGFEPDRRG